MKRSSAVFNTIWLLALLAGCILWTSQVLYADEISHSAQIPSTPTNWKSSASFPRFDPALGILDAVEVRVSSMITGSASYENMDSTPRTLELQLRNLITIRRADNSIITTADPTAIVLDPVSAFDGVLDFDGPSGGKVDNITSAEITKAVTLTAASDLAIFTGPAGNPGTTTMAVQADGDSTATGGGNPAFRVRT